MAAARRQQRPLGQREQLLAAGWTMDENKRWAPPSNLVRTYEFSEALRINRKAKIDSILARMRKDYPHVWSLMTLLSEYEDLQDMPDHESESILHFFESALEELDKAAGSRKK
jgi:hypothetical protein